jgi:hypothetical protein
LLVIYTNIVSLLRTQPPLAGYWLLHGDLAELTVISTDPDTKWWLELLLASSRCLAGNND